METPKSQIGAATAAFLAACGLVGSFAVAGVAGGAGPTAAAGQYQYGQKVTICHHTQGKKGTKHVTIRVSRSALPAHLRHGDTVGACGTRANRVKHGSKAHNGKFHKQKAKAHKAKRKHGKG